MKPICEHPEVCIRTIKQISYSGKWAELIFEEGPPEGNEDLPSWHFSYKAGYLEDALEQAGLQTDVANYGFVGLRLVLVFKRPNWEVCCFAAGRGSEKDAKHEDRED